MLPSARSARFTRLFRKDSAVVTNEELIAAPGAGKRIVIDLLYFNISVAGSLEMYFNATGITDADGVVGGNFGANGGFINLANIEGGENQPLRWTTTGTTPVTYLLIVYHLET